MQPQCAVRLELPQPDTATSGNSDDSPVRSALGSELSVQCHKKLGSFDVEVKCPAEYLLRAASSTSNALRAALDLAPAFDLFAAVFQRDAVRDLQCGNRDWALLDMETELVCDADTQRVVTTDEAATVSTRSPADTRLIKSLSGLQATGRMAFQISPEVAELPDIRLEIGARLCIPPRPNTVGVIDGGSYLYKGSRTVGSHLRLAGGSTKGANGDNGDNGDNIFFVNASGIFASARRQRTGWISRGSIDGMRVEPGDTNFGSEGVSKTTFGQAVQDWTRNLHQFGLGVVGLATLTR